jgi:hypothetical protein
MSRLRIYGDTSGYLEIKAPDQAGDQVVEIPNEAIATESYVDQALESLEDGVVLAPVSSINDGDVLAWDDNAGAFDSKSLSTTDISEGTNLYYTDQRVDNVISNSTTDDVAEGVNNLYYTDARVEAIAAPLYFTENVVDPSSNYTLVLSDLAKVVTFDTSEPRTLFVPSNASVPFPIGSVVNVYYAGGSGTITIQGAAGVTVRNAGDIADQYVEVSLRKRGTDEWVLSGNVS